MRVLTWLNEGASGSIRLTANATTDDGEGLALLAGGLVALVEHPQQLRVCGEHVRVEDRGDRFGVGGDHGRGRLDDGPSDSGESRGRAPAVSRFQARTKHWPPEGDCEPPPRRGGGSTGAGTNPVDYPLVGARYRTIGPEVPSVERHRDRAGRPTPKTDRTTPTSRKGVGSAASLGPTTGIRPRPATPGRDSLNTIVCRPPP